MRLPRNNAEKSSNCVFRYVYTQIYIVKVSIIQYTLSRSKPTFRISEVLFKLLGSKVISESLPPSFPNGLN